VETLAETLVIGEGTVEVRLSGIFDKAGVSNPPARRVIADRCLEPSQVGYWGKPQYRRGSA